MISCRFRFLGISALPLIMFTMGFPGPVSASPDAPSLPIKYIRLKVAEETTWPVQGISGDTDTRTSGITVLARIETFQTTESDWTATLHLMPDPRGQISGEGELHREVYLPNLQTVSLRGTKHGNTIAEAIKPGLVFDADVSDGSIIGLRIGDWAASQLRHPQFQRGSRLRFRFVAPVSGARSIMLEFAPHCVKGADFTDYGIIAKQGGRLNKDCEDEASIEHWSIAINGGSQMLAVHAPLMDGRGGDGGIAMESLSKNPELGEAARMLQSIDIVKTVREAPASTTWLPLREVELGTVPLVQRCSYGIVDTIWDHNGSTMGMVEESGGIALVYLEVRPGLKDIVPDGSVLFMGRSELSEVEGKAHRFKRSFPSIAYSCRGEFNPERNKLTLSGMAPKRNSSGAVEKLEAEELIFTLKAQP